MTGLLVLLAIATFVGTTLGNSRQCYYCIGNDACENNVPQVNCETLIYPLPGTGDYVCMTLSGQIETLGSTTVKTCSSQTVQNQDICTYVKQNSDAVLKEFIEQDLHVTNLTCSTCTSDLCNGSATIMTSILLVVSLLISMYHM